MWNKLEYDQNVSSIGETAKLNDKNWTVVTRTSAQDSKGQAVWRFAKQQCMHCLEPACASACFSRALQRNADGAVEYYPDLCVGCRYCMIACPFDVPKYEWSKAAPLITKCQLCSTRVAKGEAPACVAVCPTGVMKFGDRQELLQEAHQLIRREDLYLKTVYGEKEVGGTCWLYISDIPFDQLGFKSGLGSVALPSYTHSFLKNVPIIALGWGVLLTGMSFYARRRNELAKARQERLAGKNGEGDADADDFDEEA
jgi:formate dehydrogenase iron-sulfur subunit